MRDDIAISCLGKMGRFGNQLFQYAFARSYAEANEWQLRTPNWIGQKLFKNINEPLILSGSPYQKLIPESFAGPKTDLNGYFQDQNHLDWYSRDWCRKVFQFKDEIQDPMEKEDYIAVHVRRGDYYKYPDVYQVIEPPTYQSLLDELDFNLPVKWVSEDSQNDMITDFRILANAKILIRSNSTFAWWAHVLSKDIDQQVYSPIVVENDKHADTIKFVEGNYPRFTPVLKTDLHLKD
jgi:hypothetical protein